MFSRKPDSKGDDDLQCDGKRKSRIRGKVTEVDKQTDELEIQIDTLV